MAVDYARIIGIFKAFDVMTESVIANCQKFSEDATDIGGAVGSIAGNIFARKRMQRGKSVSGYEQALGELLFATIGATIGEINKSIQYCSTKQELREKIEKQRHCWYDTVSDVVSNSAAQYNKVISEEIPLLITFLQKKNLQEDNELYCNVLHQYIRQAFQLRYITEKGNRILSYFDLVDDNLEKDFEDFSKWSQSVVTLEKAPLFNEVYVTIKNKVTEFEPAKDLFSQMASDFPVFLTDETNEDSQELIHAAAVAYEDTVLKNKPEDAHLNHSSRYYNGSGFKTLFNMVSSYAYSLRIKSRKKWSCVFFVLFPLIFTIAIVSMLRIEQHFIPFIIISFLASELCGFALFKLWNRSFTKSVCKKFMKYIQTENGKENLESTLEVIAGFEFEQKVNQTLITDISNFANTNDDNIKSFVTSFNPNMTESEQAEVEQELQEISYDF